MVEQHLRARGIRDERVLAAFEELPRERFVPAGRREEAYEDHPLPIGQGQTISQPYVVALMVEQLEVQRNHRVLDVGAGSGYATGILAKLAKYVWAVERMPELTERAAEALDRVGVENAEVLCDDGSLGLPRHAPFDRIISGAAAPEVPEAWMEQLADGGRIVVPAGSEHMQELVVVERKGDRFERRSMGGVRFVKLIGAQGWEER